MIIQIVLATGSIKSKTARIPLQQNLFAHHVINQLVQQNINCFYLLQVFKDILSVVISKPLQKSGSGRERKVPAKKPALFYATTKGVAWERPEQPACGKRHKRACPDNNQR